MNGSRSATRTPITLVRRLRRLCATRLAWYPLSAITSSTRRWVSAATPYRLLITLDTVDTDTPARAATSWMVTRSCRSTAAP